MVFTLILGQMMGLPSQIQKQWKIIGGGGYCVEPDREMFKKLQQNRKSINVKAAISDKNGKAKFLKISGKAQMLSGLVDLYAEEHKDRIRREVEINGDQMEEVEIDTITFDELLKNVPDSKVIDFVSIDTEGSELMILKSIDFKRWNISVLAVENNYTTDEMRNYMREQGYTIRECRNDDIFIKRTLQDVKPQNIISKIKYMNRRRVLLKIKHFIMRD